MSIFCKPKKDMDSELQWNKMVTFQKVAHNSRGLNSYLKRSFLISGISNSEQKRSVDKYKNFVATIWRLFLPLGRFLNSYLPSPKTPTDTGAPWLVPRDNCLDFVSKTCKMGQTSARIWSWTLTLWKIKFKSLREKKFF